MFLRFITRKKDGKEHRYYSVVENVRLPGRRSPFQKTLLYLGELSDAQAAAWTKAIGVFDDATGQLKNLSLFPDDRTMLYDLTSTHFEGQAEAIPKARRGYSRDHRPDCKQVVLALIVTPEGFPVGYEIMQGNRLDKQTLPQIIQKVEALYGPAQRVWLMDRGIPTGCVAKKFKGSNFGIFFDMEYLYMDIPHGLRIAPPRNPP